MKLLSVIVPCYNSQNYMAHCLDSLLAAGSDSVEILVVNDGSKDGTAGIADDYARRFPAIIRAIHQENGGHGGAINTGLAHATGLYLKVVDSDDWVDLDAYRKVLETLGTQAAGANPVDLVISNFVYEKVGAKHKKVMAYRKMLPQGRVFTWAETKAFPTGKYLMMHSLTYRTQVLKDGGFVLPKHTFYVDNLFVYFPLERVKTLFYIDVDFYRYFIGREDQSVNETVMIKRIDQQIKVNKLVVAHRNLAQVADPKVRELMFHQLEIITAVSDILLIRSGTKESLAKKAELWAFLKDHDEALYRRLRGGLFGFLLWLPGKPGRALAIAIYQSAQKIFGFN